jgi:hypothetical protein
MPPIRGGARRTRARQVRQAAIHNEFEETFGISAEGQDLSQFIDHDDSDDDDFNDFNEEDADANATQIGQRLADIRNNFNPENIRKSSKAKATFKKHQSNHERFIVYLFEKRPDLLHPEFRDSLQDTVTEIDYSDVQQRYRRYQRNGGKTLTNTRLMGSTDVSLHLGSFPRYLCRQFINTGITATQQQIISLPSSICKHQMWIIWAKKRRPDFVS